MLPPAIELDHLSASVREGRTSSGYWSGKQTAVEEPWFDMVIKGIGWWGVLYGDLWHASLPPARFIAHM